MRVGYPSSMRYDDSVDDCLADICELFADLFESVYIVDSCDSDTKDHPVVVVSAAFGLACPF
jgi:hypothetical protein